MEEQKTGGPVKLLHLVDIYWALQCREIRAGFAMEEIMLRRIHTVQYTVSSAIVAGSLRRDSGEVRRLEAKPSIEEEVVGWSH